MPGFECYTESGKLQFDAAMPTFALKASGTATTVAGILQEASIFSVDGVPDKAFVAIGGGLGYSAAIAFTNRGDGKRFFTTDAPVGTDFNYYVYITSDHVPAAGSGLETYDDTGRLTFSSNQRPMRAPAAIWNSTGGNPYTLTGATLAYVQLTFAGHNRYSDEDHEPTGWFYTQELLLYGGSLSNSGQTLTITEIPYATGTFGPTPSFPPGWPFEISGSFIVVDVTDVPIGSTFF